MPSYDPDSRSAHSLPLAPANFAYMGPESGDDAPPKFRAIVLDDLIDALGDSGGGPIDLSGAVPITRTLTEGAGLAGRTQALDQNRTFDMGTPSSLSVSSTNSASGTTHSHAITASSNPGSVASLLKTDASGTLNISSLGVNTTWSGEGTLEVDTSILIARGEVDQSYLFFGGSLTGLYSDSSFSVRLLDGNSLSSLLYTPDQIGWNIKSSGSAEFLDVKVRGALSASVFTVGEISATAGTTMTAYSATKVTDGFATPASLTTFSFNADNSPTEGMLLDVGHRIRIKVFGIDGMDDLNILDVWAVVNSRTTHGDYATYGCTQSYGSLNANVPAGAAVVDYGPSGAGYITLSADGTIGHSANLSMATHSGSPWTDSVTRLRIGNLNDSYGYVTDTYGFGFGVTGASNSSLTYDSTNGIRIHSNSKVVGQWDNSGGITVGTREAGNSIISIDPANGIQIINDAGTVGQWSTSGDATFGLVATDHANVHWNEGNQRLEFRGSTSGTTVQSYIDTDGSFVTGSDKIFLNSNGMKVIVNSVVDTSRGINWTNSGGTTTGLISSYLDTGSSHTDLYSFNTSAAIGGVSLVASEGYGNTYFAALKVKLDGTGHTSYASLTSQNSVLAGLKIGGSYDSSYSVPTHMLEVSGTGKFTGLVGIGGSTPASAGATGETGTVTWDASYIYVCTNTNTWKRAAIATW